MTIIIFVSSTGHLQVYGTFQELQTLCFLATVVLLPDPHDEKLLTLDLQINVTTLELST